jgi:nitrite reductase/ring-hydroxylating ferredoxin subunit
VWVGEGTKVRVPIVPGWKIEDPDIGTIAARSALVARKNGRLVAYANLCRHVPLSLDLGDGEVSSADGRFFLCHHHGARYRIEDGVCEYGPCEGESLVPLGIEIEEGELILVLNERAPPTPRAVEGDDAS